MSMHRAAFAAMVAALAAACSPQQAPAPAASASPVAQASPSATPTQGAGGFTELDVDAATVASSAGELRLAALAHRHDEDGVEARVSHAYDFGDGVVLVDVARFGGMASSDYWIYRVTAQGEELVLHESAAEHGGLTPDLTWDFHSTGFPVDPNKQSYWTCRYTFDRATLRPVSAAFAANPDGVRAELCKLG